MSKVEAPVQVGIPVCPVCGKPLVEVGGRYLRCFCGYKFDLDLSREVIGSAAEEEYRILTEEGVTPDVSRPVSWEDIADALSLTIKKDYASKVITFAAMLLTQTESDQINIGFQAESSAGKTYIPLEVGSYFPKDEVVTIAGASPTAFFHEYGQWDEERKVNVVNLEGKTLIFLDFPDYRLVEKLRPLLSHDKKVLTFKITDKNEKHGLRTKTVEIIGFPTVIFCSTKLNPDEQEKTRLLLLSPSIDQAKLEQSMKLVALKTCDPSAYKALIGSDPRRSFLEDLVKEVRSSHVTSVKIEGDLYGEFVKREPKHKPRHQRDLQRIGALIKAHALLNVARRERDGEGTLIATKEDVEAGFKLYGEVSQANELGVSPYVMGIYEEVIVPVISENGTTRRDIYQSHYSKRGTWPSTQWYEKEVFPALVAAGLIVEEPDQNDKRRKLVYPPDHTMVSSPVHDPEPVLQPDNNSGMRGVGKQGEPK
jgi:hypothetical protein